MENFKSSFKLIQIKKTAQNLLMFCVKTCQRTKHKQVCHTHNKSRHATMLCEMKNSSAKFTQCLI